MMSRREMYLAIRTFEAITKLDNYFAMTTGRGFEGSDYEEIYSISDMLFENCVFYDQDSDEAYKRFMSIMTNEALDEDDKSNLLRGNDPKSMGNYIKYITKEKEDQIIEKSLRQLAKKLNKDLKDILYSVMIKYVNHEITTRENFLGATVDCIEYELKLADEDSQEKSEWYSDQLLKAGIRAAHGRGDNKFFFAISIFGAIEYDNDTVTMYFSVNKSFEPYIPILLKVLQE